MRAALVACCCLLTPAPALAGGLFTPDTGIVGFGRGGANVARADDLVSGLYYNPAGLYQIDGFSIQGGIHLLRTNFWFERAGGEDGIYNVDDDGNPIEGSESEPFPRTEKLPHIRPIPEGGFAFGFAKPDLTIALGIYAPIAPIQSFPRYGPGRYRVTEQELIQGNISLSAGWKICDWLAVGASFQLLIMQLNEEFAASSDFLASNTGVQDEEPQWDVLTSFTADDLRPHFNVGVIVFPTSWLRIGASFEPAYKFVGKGSATLSGTLGEEFFAGAGGAFIEGDGPIVPEGEDDDIDVETGLPGRIRVGVNVEPVQDVFELELDFHVELWRGSNDVRASNIDIPLFHNGDDVDEPKALDRYLEEDRVGACAQIDCTTVGIYRGENGDGNVVVPGNYRSTWSLRLGGSVTPVPILRFRFGGLYEAPATTEEDMSLTMLDGHKFLAGAGVTFRPWADEEMGPLVEIHFSYAHVFYLDRTVSADVSRGRTKALEGVPVNAIDAGTYGGSADMVGLNIAAHFGRMAAYDKARRQGGDDSD